MDQTRSDHEYFLSLLETHQRPLLKVCWVYGNSSHDRDDLLQEITGRLWSAFPRYDRNRKFLTWMYRVALNVAIDFQRRQRKRVKETASLEDPAGIVHATPKDDATKQEQLRELRELLNQQSDADRALLLLYLEGHSHRDIGDCLGMTESNVGTRLNRLKKTMRQAVQGSANDERGS